MLSEFEIVLRLGSFLALLFFFMAAENLWPKRARLFTRAQRWPGNLGLSVISTLGLRLLGPLTAYGAALWASERGYGLFNQTAWPVMAEVVLAIILLDIAVYLQHLASHKVPVLWRLHRVHHADRDIDTTTALRFHPIEILLSMLYKAAIVVAIGPLAAAVIAFEVILNGTAVFNHANMRLPARVDKALRLVLVTPDMHRVHHSIYTDEQMHNFGFNLSFWDRLFGTYQSEPVDGQEGMTIGLDDQQTDSPTRLTWMLAFPFR